MRPPLRKLLIFANKALSQTGCGSLLTASLSWWAYLPSKLDGLCAGSKRREVPTSIGIAFI